MLPVSSKAGIITPFNEALFTSTSAVCVTGLVVQDTATYWSWFGQGIILVLIQIGGLGVITIAVSFALLSGRKISLMQRSVMQEAISAPKVGGIVRLTGFVLKGTFLVEFTASIIMMPVFVKDFGVKGIWMAIFHSISAFCNAGFDLMGTENAKYASLTSYISSIDKYYNYAAHYNWRHRISYVGRYSKKQVPDKKLPYADQSNTYYFLAFNSVSGILLFFFGTLQICQCRKEYLVRCFRQ